MDSKFPPRIHKQPPQPVGLVVMTDVTCVWLVLWPEETSSPPSWHITDREMERGRWGRDGGVYQFYDPVILWHWSNSLNINHVQIVCSNRFVVSDKWNIPFFLQQLFFSSAAPSVGCLSDILSTTLHGWKSKKIIIKWQRCHLAVRFFL